MSDVYDAVFRRTLCDIAWIYGLFPALHAHVPRTTLLNYEECALSEKKKKKKKKQKKKKKKS